MLKKRLPILEWLPKYSIEKAVGDLIAGITVGMTVVPQSLAYAGVAGLPSEFGLYSSFIGYFIYVFLGSRKYLTVGTTAVSSLLIFQTAGGVWQKAVLLTFLTGFLELLMAIFQLSFIMDFVSGPVSSGFTSACAAIVFTSQIKNLFGINTEGATFLEMWISIFKEIHRIKWNDAYMGFVCIIFLLSMRFIGSLQLVSTKKDNTCINILNRLIWLCGISRNALVVAVCLYIGYCTTISGTNYFTLTGYIPSGFPQIKLPDFSIKSYEILNETDVLTKEESFLEIIQEVGFGIIVIPLIALLETYGACKAFAEGESIDVTQELITVGFSNVFTSFFQGYRVNGGLTRSAINKASGAKTQLSNLYTGLVVVVSLLFLTPYFTYIPKSCLSAVLISAVIFMIQYRVVKPMWKSKKSDLIPGFAAFLGCLIFPLHIGVFVGIGVDLITIFYRSARPKILVHIFKTKSNIEYIMITPDRSLLFPSVEFVRKEIQKLGGNKDLLPIVINCTHIFMVDFSGAKIVATLMDYFKLHSQIIYFYNPNSKVSRILRGVRKDIPLFYNIDELEIALNESNGSNYI